MYPATKETPTFVKSEYVVITRTILFSLGLSDMPLGPKRVQMHMLDLFINKFREIVDFCHAMW